MRALYLDGFAGISGDMTVGALLDLGLDFRKWKRQLVTLTLGGYDIGVERVQRSGLTAVKFTVSVDESVQPHRHLSHIVAMITKSLLSDTVKARSIKVFEKLAEAEAKVHGSTVEDVHFHEVGAVDSILDIVGAVLGFEMLGVEKLVVSPLRVGCGSINTAHGLLPVPAPATAELLRGLPVYAGDIEGEFVTPTGAAIVAALAESFGPMPSLRIERIGYGAGTRDPEGFPNALRAVLGDVVDQPEDVVNPPVRSDSPPASDDDDWFGSTNAHVTVTRKVADGSEQPEPQPRNEARAEQKVFVIETNIDDMNPQVYEYVMERAFRLHALDVFVTPVQMKKNRPGVVLTILCEAPELEAMMELLFTETTTLGVRYHEVNRRVLARSIEQVITEYSSDDPVRIKVARMGDRVVHFQPEYDDCKSIADFEDIPLQKVQESAIAAYREKLKKENGKPKDQS